MKTWKTGKQALAFRNTNLKKNSGYAHPEDVKPELFRCCPELIFLMAPCLNLQV
jgi:hypothetical protein